MACITVLFANYINYIGSLFLYNTTFSGVTYSIHTLVIRYLINSGSYSSGMLLRQI